MVVNRFSIWKVNLNPTKGSEQSGYRPVLVISPSSMNEHLNTVIVAPLTTRRRAWPTRVSIIHDGKEGEVALDQIRTLDKNRLNQEGSNLDKQFQAQVLSVLADIFAE